MRLTVLSPHRDDAVFSLALALRNWSLAGVDITVVNFFTRSDYAPYAGVAADISELRAREDHRSLNILGTSIRIRSLSLLDAPLRIPIDFGLVTNPMAFTPLSEEVDLFGRTLHTLFRRSLVLAPLALGNHIDHRTICQASLSARQSAFSAGGERALGFYEDLPYATWTEESAIRERVAEIEGQLGIRLLPTVLRAPGWRLKERAAAGYRSQIDRRLARSIARYGEKYRGGERIWVPRHGARWRALLRG